MNLTFDEKQILAVISNPTPTKGAVLARLDALQTSDFKTAKLVFTLREKIAAASENTVFIAILAAQTAEVEVDEMLKDDSVLESIPTENLLASIAGGDPEKYREDLRTCGLKGLLQNLEELGYPEETKQKIRDLLGGLQ